MKSLIDVGRRLEKSKLPKLLRLLGQGHFVEGFGRVAAPGPPAKLRLFTPDVYQLDPGFLPSPSVSFGNETCFACCIEGAFAKENHFRKCFGGPDNKSPLGVGHKTLQRLRHWAKRLSLGLDSKTMIINIIQP